MLEENHQPLQSLLENRGVKGVDLLLPLPTGLHQPGRLQEIQVVGDARLANLEGRSDLPRIEVTLAKAVQDRPASGIAERLEDQ
jgi:hypothetical protein